MKKFIISFFIFSSLSYGQTKIEFVNDAEVLTKPERHFDCKKDKILITYRISYKSDIGNPPCEVLETSNSHVKKIAQSVRAKGVCEKVVEKVKKKLEAKGFECGLKF